jgi:superfamily II DNA or RNA helicase
MQLYPHQKKFLDLNPNKALCTFEVGTGKTLIAVEWLRSRQGNAIVVVPKRIQDKWKKDLGDVKATVITKENFKKVDFENPTALVLDEAHFANSPLFTRQRSQISEKIYNFIKKYPDMPVLLLTATPISSSPANLHSLLCYIGVYIEWKQWRNKFYILERRPYLPRPAWIPRPDWRILIRPILQKYSHTAFMRDCVDYLPPITEEKIEVKSEKFVKDPEWEPMKSFVEEHKQEQKAKIEKIREIGSGYMKVVVVAYFREQIDELYKELSKDKQTYVLHGGTKEQEKVIKQAQEDEECYFIIQSSIGAGFDLNQFSVMIFASQGYSYVASVQIKGRIRRIHDLKPIKYVYLFGGRIDKAVFKRLEEGKDFDPKYFDVT